MIVDSVAQYPAKCPVGSKAQCQSEAATMSKLYHGLDYQINNVVEAT